MCYVSTAFSLLSGGVWIFSVSLARWPIGGSSAPVEFLHMNTDNLRIKLAKFRARARGIRYNYIEDGIVRGEYTEQAGCKIYF